MDSDAMPPRQYMPMPSPDEDTVYSTPFGIDLAEARRTLDSGEELDGLLIVRGFRRYRSARATI